MSTPHADEILQSLDIAVDSSGVVSGVGVETWSSSGGEPIESRDPTTGAVIARVRGADRASYDRVVDAARVRFEEWRMRPAPARGEAVRRLGELLRAHKRALGALISLEVGKIRSEGLGEVQEMIDICDFAVGLSRQLYGRTIASERARHRLMEQWLPLGPVAVISAFNFPMAVWSWNAAVALVCGDTCVWKPSPLAPLCSVAVHNLCQQALAEHDAGGALSLCVGGAELGGWMADDDRFPLVSFTGSIPAGREVATRVARRLGRSLLELGGNNAAIVLDDARLDLAVRAITFGAAGTAGQRCTTTRRVFVQRGLAPRLREALVRAYGSIEIGDPLADGVLMGPLVTPAAVDAYRAAVATAREQGGEVLTGGEVLDRPGNFVTPTVIAAPAHDRFPIAWEETFAPILYLFEVDDLEQAIGWQNAVPQGLSSAVFTESMRAAEQFLAACGSDCGIANVNAGTSGAEIGGAFGGEKQTGGGRESGSDAWRAYMRRQTATVNWGDELPLAQGVRFL
ncbi:aldehyde dehydrogenase family protein [Haliangium sp.]|uniref:aldehyde dehydrogenase family protein n=1 Tax=Haliangium sp. TaxID=2663208 RepID=UPI003D0F1E9B